MKPPFVSVIVPVFNDSERLRLCLQALQNQTYPQNLYEIIVVDNGSDEDTEGVVREFNSVILLHEKKRSSYAARNKGISFSKGDILAFTDSDCIPAPDWIEKGVINILNIPNCGLLAGKIIVFFKNPQRHTAVELYEATLAFPQKHFVEKMGFGATANTFMLREVINKVGVFNDKLKSCGDVEFGQRISSHGYKVAYADDTCVYHPARQTLRELYEKHSRIIKGQCDLLRIKHHYPFLRLLRDLFIELLPPVVSITRICFDKRFKELNTLSQKLKVLSIFFIVRGIRIIERLKLLLRGQ